MIFGCESYLARHAETSFGYQVTAQMCPSHLPDSISYCLTNRELFIVGARFCFLERGRLEHYVLHQMRGRSDFIPELNFVLEKDGAIIGQNVFVQAEIKAAD